MEAASVPSIGLNGKRFELPASNNSDKVKHCDQKKGLEKKRKKSRKKASDKSTKRSKSKNKALKPPTAVKTAVKVNAPDHGGVKANVSVGAEKTGKKSVKKRKKKPSSVPRKKKKGEPAKASKSVGDGNLKAPLQAPADNILGNKGGDRLDGPRESNQRSDLGEFSGSKSQGVYEEISHDSYGGLQEEPQAEVTGQHVEVAIDVGKNTLINWEHFSLIYEEYCLTKEVNKMS